MCHCVRLACSRYVFVCLLSSITCCLRQQKHTISYPIRPYGILIGAIFSEYHQHTIIIIVERLRDVVSHISVHTRRVQRFGQLENWKIEMNAVRLRLIWCLQMPTHQPLTLQCNSQIPVSLVVVPCQTKRMNDEVFFSVSLLERIKWNWFESIGHRVFRCRPFCVCINLDNSMRAALAYWPDCPVHKRHLIESNDSLN